MSHDGSFRDPMTWLIALLGLLGIVAAIAGYVADHWIVANA